MGCCGRRGRGTRHVDGEGPDFCFAGEVFDGCGVEEDKLKGGEGHAEGEESEEYGSV